MTLGAFFANLLAHVPLFERFDQSAAEEERYQQRRDRCVRSAKRYVLKNVERLYEVPILVLEVGIEELVKEVVDHLSSSPTKGKCSRSALTILSVATPLEPFTKIRSPSLISFANAVAASSDESKNFVAFTPASLAPATISCPRPRTPHSTSIPLAAISLPASRCSATSSGPSSSISPAITTKRLRLRPPSAIVLTMFSNERGFELYESSITVKPAAKSKTSPRIFGGCALLNARAISSGGNENAVPTADAASALLRLWRPLIASDACASPSGVRKRN